MQVLDQLRRHPLVVAGVAGLLVGTALGLARPIHAAAPDAAERILDTWLTTEFRGGRHAERVAQIAALERGEPLS